MSDKIVAFYGTKDQAERVRDELIDADYDRDDVRIFTPEGPGFWRDLKEAFGFADEADRYLYEEAARRGAIAVLVDLDDADAPGAQTAITILRRHNPLDLDVQAQQWRKEGLQGYAATGQQQRSRPAATSQRVEQGEQVVPVVEEQAKIGKRAVERGGLRVYSKVTQRPVEEQVELRQERAMIERRPADRPLGDTEKLNPDTQRMTDTFVGEICRDQRFQNRNWDEVEPQARATFEQRYPGSRWEQFKDSIRRGYEKMRAKA
jgi:Domain of unknown function (DUF2382)